MKTTAEKIAVMQAYEDGKEIEYSYKDCPAWKRATTPTWNWSTTDFRVKPEPEYIPFAFEDAEFLIGKAVKSKQKPLVLLIQVVYEKNVLMHGFDTISYYTLLQNFTFIDGSPCGKLK